jgi:hypothetical protein
MVSYKVVAFCACSGCQDVHDIGIRLSLNNGPANRQSIGDFFNSKELPPELVSLPGLYVPCPRTGRYFCQRDIFQCFLIPVSGNERSQDINHQRHDRADHGLGHT